MLKQVGLIVLVVLLIGAAYLAGARYGLTPSSPAAPPFSTPTAGFVGFAPAEVDLGDRPWGTRVPFEVTFVNHGPQVATVASVHTTCGCAVLADAPQEGAIIPPGGYWVLAGTLDTERTPGRRQQSVILMLASGAQYVANLRVNVRGTYELTPQTLDFGAVDLDEPVDGDPRVVFFFESENDQLAGDAALEVPWLQCQVAEQSDGRTTFLLSLRKEFLAPGLNTSTVCVPTTNSVKPSACVYVRVLATRALTATPQHVFLVGDEVKRVRFTDRAGRGCPVATVVECDSRLDVRILDTGEIEVSNPSHARLGAAVQIGIRDSQGRRGVVLVSGY